MPEPGDPDHRRSAKLGDIWAEDEIASVGAAILWLALKEHVPDTGLKLEDMLPEASLSSYLKAMRTLS